MQFCHLHVHSHYSLLDGLTQIKDLVDFCQTDNATAIALTDHGAMYGVIEFYKACKKAGIKPIIGLEAYISPGSRFDKASIKGEKNYFHLLLLAKNNIGYQNLLKLTTIGYLEGYYYKPRIDWEVLEKYHEGLIACSACLGGEIPRLIIAGNYDKAKQRILDHQALFGTDNYYLEIQDHPEHEANKLVNSQLIQFSRELHVPLVATNDVHYAEPDDDQAQDILLCLQNKNKKAETKRMSMLGVNYSLRSSRDMIKAFADTPEAIANTVKIAEMCNVEIELDKVHLPHFQVPEGHDGASYLRYLCLAGLVQRYGKNYEIIEPVYRERLDYELEVINKMGWPSYFLIVSDFVNWAKNNKIVVGPGRGSAAGSLVSYLIGITNLCPIKYELLFERFLNPERISMPDIDLDFSDIRRNEVISYVQQKYGADHVAQIITFGTMAARAAIRDVGRVLDYPYDFCDKLAKMVPMFTKLSKAVDSVPELKEIYKTDEAAKEVLDYAMKLEGVARHVSTHACGVLITKHSLTEYVPLQHASSSDNSIVSQYSLHPVEDLGLLKMDFLGLKNLTIIEAAIKIIKNTRGLELNIDHIPLADPKTFTLFAQGETTGVFQCESSGFKRYLKELQPTEFEDIIAMVALYRPGPMEVIPDYIAQKHGRKKPVYLHPKLEPILKTTHGVAIYQEQLMRMARDLAGFTMGEADVLRKAVGKKIPKLLAEQKIKFIEGCVKKGINSESAEKIFSFIEPFAGYGFNRCLTGDTLITNAQTGQQHTMSNLQALFQEGKKLPSVFTLGDNWQLTKGQITAVHSNGVKIVYQIKTRLGKVLKATSNHPLRTMAGWQQLKDLQVGDRIAVAKNEVLLRQPHQKTNSDVYWDEIVEIKKIGREPTYDLTIANTHNYVANDIVVHNSHAACYAMVAYQTAYLKANWPTEFMAALLTADQQDTDRVAIEIDECRRMSIEVRQPDINQSFGSFTVVTSGTAVNQAVNRDEDSKTIRFGLKAIKNVGDHIADVLIAERKANGPYRDIVDLLSRVEDKDLNKKSLESLIKCGALDQFNERGQLLGNIENLLQFHRDIGKDRRSDQGNLFGDSPSYNMAPQIRLLSTSPATNTVKLAWEKELLGLYVSEHPFNDFRQKLLDLTIPLSQLRSRRDEEINVAGVVTTIKSILTRKNERMMFVKIEDGTDNVEILVFPKLLQTTTAVWQIGQTIICQGTVSDKDNEIKILANQAVVLSLEHLSADVDKFKQAILVNNNHRNGNGYYQKNNHQPEPIIVSPPLSQPLKLIIAEADLTNELVNILKQLFTNHPGSSSVYIKITKPESYRVVELASRVNNSQALLDQIRQQLGQQIEIKLDN
ncbi:MAG: DNA polymerase III subunit alpha [bacterium]